MSFAYSSRFSKPVEESIKNLILTSLNNLRRISVWVWFGPRRHHDVLSEIRWVGHRQTLKNAAKSRLEIVRILRTGFRRKAIGCWRTKECVYSYKFSNDYDIFGLLIISSRSSVPEILTTFSEFLGNPMKFDRFFDSIQHNSTIESIVVELK